MFNVGNDNIARFIGLVKNFSNYYLTLSKYLKALCLESKLSHEYNISSGQETLNFYNNRSTKWVTITKKKMAWFT